MNFFTPYDLACMYNVLLKRATDNKKRFCHTKKKVLKTFKPLSGLRWLLQINCADEETLFLEQHLGEVQSHLFAAEVGLVES